MSQAQVSSSFAEAGEQVKMRRRLGVSETPVTTKGPAMVNDCRCGSAMNPGTPALISTIDCSTWRNSSSVGPSNFAMNAADTRCGPALTGMRGVVRLTFVSGVFGSILKRAARAPSIETSISCPCRLSGRLCPYSVSRKS